MTTISIKEDTRKKLLRIAGELQKEFQRRVDFDSVIRFLIDIYMQKQIDRKAWKKFTTPLPNIDFETVYQDLIMERGIDEKRHQ